MKKIILFALVSFLMIFSGDLSAQKTEHLNLKKLDTYIEDALRAWNIPGMAVAIVKDGEIIFEKGYGVKEKGKIGKVDEHTLFGIASNTKAFTAAALGVLVDQGKIRWDDRVIEYLPWFELYDPYVTANMTIKDLLTHRSGLKTFSGDLLWYATTYSREEIVRRARFLQPTYGFRDRYGYSNIMYLAAGLVVEAVTDTSYDEFLDKHFFEPLGMKNTNTSIHSFGDYDNIAQPHSVLDDKNVPIPFVSWDNIAPAGGINSSVHDMAAWMMMNINKGDYEGEEVLSDEIVHKMQQPVIVFEISESSLEIWPSMHWRAYGLGWSLFEYHGHKVVNHGGGLDGMISRVSIVPDENLGIVILTNNNNSIPAYLMYEILDRYFGKDGRDWVGYGLERANRYEDYKTKQEEIKKSSRVKNTSPSFTLSAYTGTYGDAMYGNAEVYLENEQLKIKFIPTPLFDGELSHWHFDTFTIKLTKVPSLPEGTVRFIMNENAEIKEMVVDIPNPDFDFTELKFYKIK